VKTLVFALLACAAVAQAQTPPPPKQLDIIYSPGKHLDYQGMTVVHGAWISAWVDDGKTDNLIFVVRWKDRAGETHIMSKSVSVREKLVGYAGDFFKMTEGWSIRSITVTAQTLAGGTRHFLGDAPYWEAQQ
jgi:hypothetical protein